MKTYRKLSDRATYKEGGRVYGRMGKVEIRDQAVSLSQHLPYDDNAPKYSDADIELLIARLKVARESIIANIDEHIAILQEVLKGEGR